MTNKKQLTQTFFLIVTILLYSFLPSRASAITITKRSPDPVFSTGATHPWDREEVEGSSILLLNGKYRMWYTGFDGKIHRIGLAESDDGITWKKNKDFVLGPEFSEQGAGVGMGHPSVLLEEGVYKMWYVASDGEGSMIGYAISDDGVEWKKNDVSVLESQSYYTWTVKEMYYPCVIKDGEGYRMYFAGYDGYRYSIGLALSKDGIHWKPHADAPVFSNSENNERGGGFSHPFVIKKPSGNYDMWLSEMVGQDWTLRRASSPDGIKWEKDQRSLARKGEHGSWDTVSVYRPLVISGLDSYTMWYSGSDGYRIRTGMLTSKNGKNWLKHANNPVIDVSEGLGWENESLNGGTLLKDGDLYKLWYSGYNGSKTRIGYAISKDGIHWEKSTNNPVLENGRGGEWDRMGVAYPSVVIDEQGFYRMWYLGYNGEVTSIGSATSTDGVQWKKGAGNPLLAKGKKGEWDAANIMLASVLFHDGVFKMWYGGSDGKTTRIGLATSRDGEVWEKWKGNPVLKEDDESGVQSVSFPSVILDGEIFRLWYSGLGKNGYRIFEAESGDGIIWKKKNNGKPVLDINNIGILETKGAMVYKDGREYLMAYEELNGNTNLIALATSGDGSEWKPYGKSYILDVGVGDGWDAYGVSGPCVLKEEGGTYRMWYAGHDSSTFRIGMATSKDGGHWERYAKNPVLDRGPLGAWDSERVAYPSVIRDGMTYKMWYHGHGLQSPPGIGLATSKDGFQWTKDPIGSVIKRGSSETWDSFAIGYPSALKDGDIYKIWYAGLDRNYGTWRIGYAESRDGVKWEKHPDGPVLDVGSGVVWDNESISYPTVIKTEHGFTMFYIGFSDQTFRVGVAVSQDGIKWEKARNNPLIDIGKDGAFDEASSLALTVIPEGGKYRIWYTGISGGQYRIGYAEAMEGELMAGLEKNGNR